MRTVVGGLNLNDLLATALGGGGSDDDDGRKTTRDRDVQVEEIRIMGEAYAKSLNGCPYAVGDWITPRATAGVKGAGEPHLVVEVIDTAEPSFRSAVPESSSEQGRRLDIRVLCYVGNDAIAPFWSESWMYEPYNDKAVAKLSAGTST